MKYAHWLLACVLLGLGLSLSGCGTASYQIIRPIENPTAAPDFSLIDQHGAEFHLAEQRGKIVILFFGFTACPDVCPLALGLSAQARKQLGADGDKVQIAFVTVDPERDNPATIDRYVSLFDSTILGLNGETAAVEAVKKDYGVHAQRRELPGSALQYTIDHTAGLYIIDQQGRWFAMANHDVDPTLLATDLKTMLQYIAVE